MMRGQVKGTDSTIISIQYTSPKWKLLNGREITELRKHTSQNVQILYCPGQAPAKENVASCILPCPQAPPP